MKNLNFIHNKKSQIVCTDGSTLIIDFPYKKRNLFLTNDLKNMAYYSNPNNAKVQANKFNKSPTLIEVVPPIL